jgi:hypothetical protein
MKHATKQLWAEAQAMWIDGRPVGEIAKHIGLTKMAVYWRRMNDRWPQRRPCQLSRLDWTNARAMWVAGESVEAIGASLGVQPRTVL